MRIGLYGLPTAGKSYVLNAVRNLEVLSGSTLLKEIAPDFHDLTEDGKVAARIRLTQELEKKDKFIMDGHYSFGDNVVFTEADGKLYDVFLYLHVDPEIITERMKDSIRNSKYLAYDIDRWQKFEIESLRNYCHLNNKDFYVIDNPTKGFFPDISMVLEFIDSIVCGYSCVNYAREVATHIPACDVISLIDGDRTFIEEDSSAALGYRTHTFDGNFYSGFQAWRHNREQADYLRSIDYQEKTLDKLNITINSKVIEKAEGTKIILTTGHYGTWKQIADEYNIPLYYGPKMCSDTKYFITKFIQDRGMKVIAFGDSMNDYYMLRQADNSYLILKKDGSISSSFGERELEGFVFV